MFLVALSTFAAAFVQSTTGMGLALVLGPALFAALDPEEAVTIILILGIAINVLVLLEDGARENIAWREVTPLVVAAAPGIFGGALVLDALPKSTLQIVLGVAVIAAVLIRTWRRRHRREDIPRPPRRGLRAAQGALGLLLGALTTTTTVNGPPMALWFQARGLGPAALRQSLNVCFLAFSVMGTIAVVAVLGGGRSLDSAPALLVLIPLLWAGYAVGRRAFERIGSEAFESALAGVILAAGVASLVAGIA